jgi:hypothetical protein
MERWDAYVLGAFGMIVVVAAIALQVAALIAGETSTALLSSLGVVGGALLFRWGYRIASR